MPRGSGIGRGTRYTRGQISGVSFATYPSGTTITKDGIETTTGTTTGCYVPLQGGLTTYTMVAGVSNCAAGKLVSVDFGLSTIIMTQCSVVTNTKNATSAYCVICPHQEAADQSWTGVTQVDVYLYHGPSGTTLVAPCSVSYFAIGVA